ncbi:TonB-dependent receptor plug domain-containing protein [Desulfoluna butyratoxydans]|uniref:Tonb-dependent receptor beta-barrel n=1 Tax=Desulfoluna butyratoxydans TaxID=231438 RepID=A0A4V6ILX7_9BACT|nr:TonB-dependent receptor [Desulfoluna butyratoxydans]VFQ46838.1 tonb-dependent receptor beta-barrel [Desulfoluna butyratoxydans]
MNRTSKGSPGPRARYFMALSLLLLLGSPLRSSGQEVVDLSIEDLMNINVTSVGKKEQHLSDSTAAVFVITNQDLKRSGVTNIPDALRMVPGLTVSRIDSNKWAVNSRGATSRFADKLLVFIDGRTVYTPFFSGVYWEVQDVMLEDVDRIEVIRGPGATLWGANAVNGVINIITRQASDTVGGVVTVGGGTTEEGFAEARYGAALGKATHGRFYAKGFKRDEFERASGDGAGDDWEMAQGGFRVDTRRTARDSFTFQGDLYDGEINQEVVLPSLAPPYAEIVEDTADVSGGNLLTRWQRVLSSTSDLSLQLIYDVSKREEAFTNEEKENIDVDFQHHFKAGERHDIVWGAGYQRIHDELADTSVLTYSPESRTDDLFSAFLQDEILLSDNRLWLTLGSKVEHNESTGYEVQPSARLLFSPRPNHKLWAAVSRAVRTPSRVERDGEVTLYVVPPLSAENPSPLPVVVTGIGVDDEQSEELIAYEVGYRFMPRPTISVDIAGYYHDYDHLRVTRQGAPEFQGTYIKQPFLLVHEFSSRAYGAELATAWQVTDWLKEDLAYTYLNSNLEEEGQVGREPTHQVSLRSAVDMGKDLELDLWLRYVDDSSAAYAASPDGTYEIDDYLTLDIRLSWSPAPALELSVVGQNLLDERHPEYVMENYGLPTEVPRSVYGKITYRF